MSDQAWKEADSLTANCTHGLEFAETGEHYADLRTRIRACIAYQIVERDRARQNDHATALAAVAAERERTREWKERALRAEAEAMTLRDFERSRNTVNRQTKAEAEL